MAMVAVVGQVVLLQLLLAAAAVLVLPGRAVMPLLGSVELLASMVA